MFNRDEVSVILNFLPLKDVVMNIMLVSKQWRDIAIDNSPLWINLLNAYFKWDDFVKMLFPDIEMEILTSQNQDRQDDRELSNVHYDFLVYLFSLFPKFKSVEEDYEDLTNGRMGDELYSEQLYKFKNPIRKNIGDEIDSEKNLMKLSVILSCMIADEYRTNPITDQVVLHKCFWDKDSKQVDETVAVIPLSFFCLTILMSEGDGWFSILNSLFPYEMKTPSSKYSKIVYGVSPPIESYNDSDDEEELKTISFNSPFCYFSNMDANYCSDSPYYSPNEYWKDMDGTLFPVYFNAGSPYHFYQMDVNLNEEEGTIYVRRIYGSGYY